MSRTVTNTVHVSPARRTPAGPGVTDGAWQWEVTEPRFDGRPDSGVTGYRTNKAGNGLWICGASTAEDRQIRGTYDFSLNCSPSTRRARVLMTSTEVADLVDARRADGDPTTPQQAYAELRG